MGMSCFCLGGREGARKQHDLPNMFENRSQNNPESSELVYVHSFSIALVASGNELDLGPINYQLQTPDYRSRE
jgi:hypothetical protein